MAGARPEHLPVILTIAEGQHPSLPSSTGSYGSMVVVNGPVRDEIGMNSGGGAFGPFNYANAVIGRAWTLMSINFGDARLGDTFMATLGNGLSFTNQCCAENEEKSAWKPFHVRNGFAPEESAVSLFRGWNVLTLGVGGAENILKRMKEMSFTGAYTFVLDPLVAKGLKEEGYDDPRRLSEWLAGRMDQPHIKPESINFVVVGGETNPIWQTTDYVYYKTLLIDKWIPEGGIRKDERPLRMPAGKTCADGTCGII